MYHLLLVHVSSLMFTNETLL